MDKSEDEKIVFGNTGVSESISEACSKGEVIIASPGIEWFGNLFSDGFSVQDNILFNNLHMINWVLNSLDNLVEGSPVQDAWVNLFADWDGLLNALDKSKCSNEGSDDLLSIVFIVSINQHMNNLVENFSILIGFIDANKEVGEVECSNFGGKEETLKERGNILSIKFLDWFLVNSLLHPFDWFWFVRLSCKFHDITDALSEFLVFFGIPGSNSRVDILENWNSVDEDIFFNDLEVFGWVRHQFLRV